MAKRMGMTGRGSVAGKRFGAKTRQRHGLERRVHIDALERRTLLSTTFLSQAGWVASDSTNSGGTDVASNAIDGNLATRWSTDAAQTNGQYLQVDLGTSQTFNTLTMDTGPSTGDYPRGYAVYVSNNNTDWSTDPAVATGAGSGEVTTAAFSNTSDRYVRIVQTGSSTTDWWSVGELTIGSTATFLPHSAWVASDSTNSTGSDIAANAIDGNLTTRWSTDATQTNGQYLEINLGTSQNFNTLTMDTGPSTGDYPRGYAVYVSNNNADWSTDTAVATGAGSGQLTTVTFAPTAAQYVRIVQTGTSTTNWWSVAELNIGTTATTTNANNPNVIDLLVAYTASAVQGAGSAAKIDNLIDRSVADINEYLTNSMVNETLRLVGIMQTSYTENPAGGSAILGDMANVADIQAMKTQTGADLVDLWVSQPGTTGESGQAGIPNLSNPSGGGIYAEQAWNIADNFLMAHELGHLLGAGHTTGDTSPHITPYAYGYIATVGAATYGTVMDIPAVTGGQIDYYSNPNVLFRGVPVGSPDNSASPADNAGAMNLAGPLIANYAATVVSDTTPPLAGLDQVVSPMGQNTINFQVTYYDNSGVNATTLGNSNIQVTGPNGFSATATFSGISIDGTLTNVGPNTKNSSIIIADYTVNTPSAPGDLTQYAFSMNANQVKDINGNAMPAGTLLVASGGDPNVAGTQLLPRYAGYETGTAAEIGDLANENWRMSDFAGAYFNTPLTYADDNLYHFSLSTARTLTINVTGPNETFNVYQDKNGDGVLDRSSELIAPLSAGVYNLPAGTNYYLQIGVAQTNTSAAQGGIFTATVIPGAPTIIPPPPPATASISGTIFNDANGNGVQDAGEAGIAGAYVQLTGTDTTGNAVSEDVQANASGQYTFSNLVASNASGYTITLVPITGYPISGTVLGNGGGTISGVNTVSGIVLAVGTTVSGYNYNEMSAPLTATISGRVFNDTNGNDAYDAGEPGIGGITITLTGTSSAGAAVDLTATTAADGTYSITGVPDNNADPFYTLTVGTPVGFNGETPLPGTGATGLAGTASDNNSIGSMVINPGDNAINYYFPKVAAPTGQVAPAAAAMTLAIAQGGTATGNVLATATPGTTTGATAQATMLIADAVTTTKTKQTRLQKNQSVMFAAVTSMPQHAESFTLNADGTFTYVPEPGFYGKDTFLYTCVMKATDECTNADKPVTIIVRKKDQPATVNDEARANLLTNEGMPLTIDLDSYVTDADRKVSALHFILAKNADGVFKLNRDGHTATFTPTDSFSGNTTLSFKVTDGTVTSGTFSLTVTVEPIAANLTAANVTLSTTPGKPVAVNLLSNILEAVVGAKITISITGQPTTGTATLSNGKIVYHPHSAKGTTDSVTYQVTDNLGNSATGTVTVDIV